ncbi:MAG: PQQ-like beta-propeller repeat protein, partial [Bacteroidetes bacterium]|nr:PQQ-like beta-propeller repeat protein [Bacteroidota bacterium]
DLTKSGGHLATPPLAVNGRLIIATLEGEVIVSKEKTGEEIMRFSTGEQIRYQPVVDQGKIYVTTMKGKMFCFETKDKKLTGWTTWGANAAHTNRVE